jgi:cytidine deaminase
VRKKQDVEGDAPERPEIILGLVGALGTPLSEVADRIQVAFDRVGYKCHELRLSTLLKNLSGDGFKDVELVPVPEDKRLASYMAAGTHLRTITNRGDVLAGLAMGWIRNLRPATEGDEREPNAATVYLLNSLKHPHEIATLRRAYAKHFVSVGVYTKRDLRVHNVARDIGTSSGIPQTEKLRSLAEDLIATDQEEENKPLGQKVRDAFPLCDYFINASYPASIEDQINRLIRILFLHPFVTPLIDEYGMFHAHASARRSGALSRQVGAAITSEIGDVLAVGMNEVPKAGGGHYWEGDPEDARDYALGFDQNKKMSRTAIRQVLLAMQKRQWLCEGRVAQNIDNLVMDALLPDGPLHDSMLTNITEYGREVHAEMSAIVTAARLGTKIGGATLYTTTFPCHNCAKHIVAAGIKRVVYIEPYSKSFAGEFHLDSITLDDPSCSHGKVLFEPFSGVAPRNYMSWFDSQGRKDEEGKALHWNPRSSQPRFTYVDPGYLPRERDIMREIYAVLSDQKVELKQELETDDEEKD